MKLNEYELYTLKQLLEKEIDETESAIEWNRSNLDFDKVEKQKGYKKLLESILQEVEYDRYKLYRKDEQQ